jgi:hypothetical protein
MHVVVVTEAVFVNTIGIHLSCKYSPFHSGTRYHTARVADPYSFDTDPDPDAGILMTKN